MILTIPGACGPELIYEAGPKTLASGLTAADMPAKATADDVEQQVAMGLYGALVAGRREPEAAPTRAGLRRRNSLQR